MVQEASELAAKGPGARRLSYEDRMRLVAQRRDAAHASFERGRESVFTTAHRPTSGWTGHVDRPNLWRNGVPEREVVLEHGRPVVVTTADRGSELRVEHGEVRRVPLVPTPDPVVYAPPDPARDIERAVRTSDDPERVLSTRRLSKGGLGSW